MRAASSRPRVVRASVSDRARASSASRARRADRPTRARAQAHPLDALRRSDAVSAALALAAVVSLTVSPAHASSDTSFCVKKCEKECTRIAPGSEAYCAETCADECDAMAAEGADISENSSTSVFTTKKESSGVENVLVGIIDKSAVFFAPGAELAKDPACDDKP